MIVGTCPTFRKLFLAHFSKNYFCKTQRTVTRERSIYGKPRVSIREFEFAASGPRDRNFTRSWSELMTSPRFVVVGGGQRLEGSQSGNLKCSTFDGFAGFHNRSHRDVIVGVDLLWSYILAFKDSFGIDAPRCQPPRVD